MDCVVPNAMSASTAKPPDCQSAVRQLMPSRQGQRDPPSHLKSFLPAALAAAVCLAGCGTTRRLPEYEPPLARTEFQTVRTTAYTDTESDHLQVWAARRTRRAFAGGQPAGCIVAPAATAAITPEMARGVYAGLGYGRAGSGRRLPATGPPSERPCRWFTAVPRPIGRAGRRARSSASAETGQCVSRGRLRLGAFRAQHHRSLHAQSRDDGRVGGPSRADPDRVEWGDREESLRILRGRDKFRHIQRMVLELEGRRRAAARLQ